MNNYDDPTFWEIKVIVERQFNRRMLFVRQFIIGVVLIGITATVGYSAFMLGNQALVNRWMTLETFKSIHVLLLVVGTGIGVVILAWIFFKLFMMLFGNAQDRALRRAIDTERKWRMRQWHAGMYGDVPPPSYLLTDDGEIEEEYYQDKHKRNAALFE